MGEQLMADRALRKAEQAGDLFRLLEAAYEVDSTIDDVLEAVLRAGTWGDTSPFGLTQVKAVGIPPSAAASTQAFYRKTVGWMLDLAYAVFPTSANKRGNSCSGVTWRPSMNWRTSRGISGRDRRAAIRGVG